MSRKTPAQKRAEELLADYSGISSTAFNEKYQTNHAFVVIVRDLLRELRGRSESRKSRKQPQP